MAKQTPTALSDAQAAQAEAVRLQEDRDKARPTPTQEENDLAKLGALDIDAKQADGSAEERSDAPSGTGAALVNRAESTDGGTSYKNRATKSE